MTFAFVTSNRSGIDLEKPGTDLRYEVMVAGRWDTHNGESFQSNPWRSLTYTPLSEEDRNVG